MPATVRKIGELSIARPVKTKPDFYKRFERGEFGNCGPFWSTLDEWAASGHKGEIGIRTKSVGTRCDYNVPHKEVRKRYREFIADGYRPEIINLSAMMPDEYMILQGEVQRTDAGLYLFGATVKSTPMRPALRNHGFHVYGLEAKSWLESSCDPASYDELMELLDRFPDHTIEFSALEIHWGVIKNRNTCIWEVRQY